MIYNVLLDDAQVNQYAEETYLVCRLNIHHGTRCDTGIHHLCHLIQVIPNYHTDTGTLANITTVVLLCNIVTMSEMLAK